jgi:ATP-binding cassette, subfamily B, bacterial
MDTSKEAMKLFVRQAWRYPGYVIGLLIGAPITVLVHQFLPPLIVASILERLAAGQFTPGNWQANFGSDIFWYAILSVAGAIVGWRVVIFLIWKLELKVVRDLHNRMFGHLMRQSADFHANHFGGSLVSQTNKLGSAYVTFADTTVFEVVTMIAAFAITSVILWPKAPLFVIFMLVLSAIFMATAMFVSRRVRKLNAIEAEASNRQTGFLADALTNVFAIKSFAGVQHEEERYAESIHTWQTAARRLMGATLRQQSYFAAFTTVLGIVALLLAVIGVVQFGAEVATVYLIVSFTNNIGQRLWEFSQHTLRSYNKAMGDAKAMVEILNEQPSVRDAVKPEPARITSGDITFNNVSFTHADAKKDDALFKDLSLHITAGEKIGLVGHSGSGKTTLTKLLLRFADVDGGTITIDGQNIARITQDDLRRSIAYVPQEPLLFHRSLRENIAYGKPDATDEEVKEAARRAHAAEFIEKLPNGYATEVGERGVKLSGGQRQRIAIARAMLKNAPILVLDEATSALDSESEKLIQAALWELMKDRTAIVIAHRLSTIQRMDSIVVLDNGTILEQGSHQELLASKGIYANLWAHQSGGFIED